MSTAETEVVDAVVVEPPPEPHHGTEIAHRTFGSTELIVAATAAEKVAIATEIATALDHVIKAQGMRTKVGNARVTRPDGSTAWEDKYHVNVEAWQTLATFLGLAVVPCPSRRVIDPATGQPERVQYTITKHIYARGTKGADIKSGRAVVERTETAEVDGYSWECRVEVFKDGALIASGDGMCSRTEQTWRDRDDFALRGMAQTRGTSRAIAGAAKWIVALAGYATTPAEEYGAHEAPTGPPAEAGPAYGPPVPADRRQAALAEICNLLDGGSEDPAELRAEAIALAREIAKAAGYVPRIVVDALTLAAAVRMRRGSAVGAVKAEPKPPPSAATKAAPVTPPDAVRVLDGLAKGMLEADVRGAFHLSGLDFPTGAKGAERWAGLTEAQATKLMERMAA